MKDEQLVALDAAAKFAASVADGAREIAMGYFRRSLDVERKSDESPVTIADREIESYIRARIVATFPDHGILGEEEAPENLDRRYVWVIDPIDGTKSFVTGHPLFGGLVALLRDGIPCLGQIDIPGTGERWTANEGGPARLNGAVCKTRGCRTLSNAYAYTTDPALFAGEDRAMFEALRSSVAQMRFGGDCYNYALLSSGFCDLVVETGLQPYDYLPVVQVVESAGGVITDWNGFALTTKSDGRVLAAATKDLHHEALTFIRDALG